MSEMTCDAVRAVLPDSARGALDPDSSAALEAHVAGCPNCAGEASLVRALQDLRPVPTPDLEGRIQDALRDAIVPGAPAPRNGRTLPRWTPQRTWGLAAAAALVLALGTSVLWPQIRGTVPTLPEEGSLAGPMLMDDWGGNRGIIAGVPVIEELSDEQLLTLLEELGG